MLEIPAELVPLASFTRNILAVLQWFLGGIFGLYVVLIALRIYSHRKLMKKLNGIEKKIDKLSKK